MDDELKSAHGRSFRSRNLFDSGTCGCFHCLKTFDAGEINAWTDGGMTPLCPHCNIDSVLSSKTDPIDLIFLKKMRARWFEQTTRLDI